MADSPAAADHTTATTAAAKLINSAKNQIPPIFTHYLHSSLAKFHDAYPQLRQSILTQSETSIRSSQGLFDDAFPPGERAEAMWKYVETGNQYLWRFWRWRVHELSEVTGLEERTLKFVVVGCFVGWIAVRLGLCRLGMWMGKTMTAPGRGGGVKIYRRGFEANPKGYFRSLRGGPS